VLELATDAAKPERPLWSLDELETAAPSVSAEPWRQRLYFLLHLAAVEEAGRLLHKLRKWEILAEAAGGRSDGEIADRIGEICETLELYLDMHDAKFEGGEALVGAEAFRDLFEDAKDFDRVYSPPDGERPGANDDRRVPRRALREIMRFGDLRVLAPIFDKHRVAAGDVLEYHQAERASPGEPSPIAKLQERRESLHDKWARKNKQFSDEDRAEYEKTLAEVTRHRHLAARVTLTDHVRLHRLLMAVQGRVYKVMGSPDRSQGLKGLGRVRKNRPFRCRRR
jgi:hypothetical protein